MDIQNSTKINQLLKILPQGTVALQTWLNRSKISRQLADSYCKHNWLSRLGYGAYIRSGDIIDWTGAIYALQKEISFKMHVGGETALSMSGVGHYIHLSPGTSIWLFVNSTETKKIPVWFKKEFAAKHKLQVKRTQLFLGQWNVGLYERNLGNYSILVSTPERAIMECLYLVPKTITIQHSSTLIEKLRSLRPDLTQQLLECCNSIKVKRLFLYLAELHNQSWFKSLDLSKISLGSGKRQITSSGHYIPKYKLSLADLSLHEGYPEDEE